MKILIVDDEVINRRMLISMLNDAGYCDCTEAQNGQEALEIIKHQKPDLVLLDVVMPGISGYEVARQIRALAKGCYLPILFITALEDKASLVKCLEVGGNDFAVKPFDKLILMAKIRAHEKIISLTSHIEQQNDALRFYQQRIDKEHAIVEHIFNHAMVNRKEIMQYFDCSLSPAETFNGDIFRCEQSPRGGMYFLVGDFTGHGLSSAIGALPVMRAFQEMTTKGVSVSDIAIELNDVLLRFLPDDMFMVAIIGEVQSDGTHITLWQGGMPQVLVVSDDRKIVRYLPSQHMALGILEAHEFESECEHIEMVPGDKLVMYSDGLIEATDPQGNMLNEEGVEYWCQHTEQLSAKSLFDYAASYSGSHTFNDDVSIVLFTSQPLNIAQSLSYVDDIPCRLQLTLDAKHLKQDDIVSSVFSKLLQLSAIQNIRSTFFTVFSEMFNNALEHGILNMNSLVKNSPQGFQYYYEQRAELLSKLTRGTVRICVEYIPSQQQVLLCVEDSGAGLDDAIYFEQPSEMNFGRGLALINALTAKVWFEQGGNKINCLMNTSGFG